MKNKPYRYYMQQMGDGVWRGVRVDKDGVYSYLSYGDTDTFTDMYFSKTLGSGLAGYATSDLCRQALREIMKADSNMVIQSIEVFL